MKIIFKIILFLISLILTLMKYISLFVLNAGTILLSLISGLIAVGAVAFFVNGETEIGITVLILAFLLSPYGLPFITSKLIIGIESI